MADLDRLGGRPALARVQYQLAVRLRARGRPEDLDRAERLLAAAAATAEALPLPRLLGGVACRSPRAQAAAPPPADPGAGRPAADVRSAAGGGGVERELRRPGGPPEGQPVDADAGPAGGQPGPRVPCAGPGVGRRRPANPIRRATSATPGSCWIGRRGTATSAGWRTCGTPWRRPSPWGMATAPVARGRRSSCWAPSCRGRSAWAAAQRRAGAAAERARVAVQRRVRDAIRRIEEAHARGRPAPAMGRAHRRVLLVPTPRAPLDDRRADTGTLFGPISRLAGQGGTP